MNVGDMVIWVLYTGVGQHNEKKLKE